VSGSLGRRYARALLDLARAEDALAAYGDELGRTLAAFEDPRLRMLCLSPALPRDVRTLNTKEVVAALGLSRMVGNLIGLLGERDQLALLPEVVRCYETLLDDALGRARVTIRTATPLRGEEQEQLMELARKLTGRGEVLPTAEVDPELLGGLVLAVGGTVYDGSLRAQIARLGKEMAERGA